MGDGLKSVVLAAVVLFVYLVVLEGEFVRRRWGGAPSITFCETFADVWLLGSLPCFALDAGIILLTLLSIILAYGLLSRLRRLL